MTNRYWKQYKEVAPLRHLRALYRLLHRQMSGMYTSKELLHRLGAEWSYLLHLTSLRVRLRREASHGIKRPVVVISQVLHMGDIVACEPVVRRIRLEHPGAFLVFALHRDYKELAESHPDIDHVLPLACVTEWVRCSRCRLFDRVIDLNLQGRSCNLCRIPLRKGDGGNGVSFDNYFEFGSLLSTFSKSAGISPQEEGPRLYPSQADVNFVDQLQLPMNFICLHAGSNEAIKNYPIAAWREVVRHVNSKWGVPVVEVGLQRLVLLPDDRINRSLCGDLSILGSAEVIRRSILYLGGDSGPAHIANAMGVFGVIILGVYRHFRRYQPFSGSYGRSENCELIQHDGPVADVPSSVVCAAIDRRMSNVLRLQMDAHA